MNENMLQGGRIGRAVGWSFAAEAAAKLLVPVTNMILARILTPEVFGIMAAVNLVISFADMLSSSGISRYIVQHEFASVQELHQFADVAFWTNIAVSMGAWCGIALFSRPLSAAVGNPGYELPLVIAALSLPLSACACMQESLFQRELHYRTLFYRRLAVSLLPFGVTIPLALLGGGYWSLIAGTLAGECVKILMLARVCPWKPKLYFSWKKLKQMLSFCSWMLADAVAVWLTTYVDVLLVSRNMSDYDTGLYRNAQITVTGILSIVTAATASVLFASLSRSQSNEKAFQKLLYGFQKRVGLVVLPMGVGIFCFRELITRLLLGQQWMEAADFIGLYGLSTAVNCMLADYCITACRAKGRPDAAFWAQLLHLAFLIPVCQFGVAGGFHRLIYVRSAAKLELSLLCMVVMWMTVRISPLKMLGTLKEAFLCAVLMGSLGTVLLERLPGGMGVQIGYMALCGVFYSGIVCLIPSCRGNIREAADLLRRSRKHP